MAPLGPAATGGSASGSRDETAYYQAETQNLTRENQMLRQRIRELGELLVFGGAEGCG